jgi:polysaccharide pyruvyl transferase WcaK-like protein
VTDPVRVGLHGILGAGNIGNDASLESLLYYMRNAHPDLVLDAMCTGPERVREAYGIDASPRHWQQKFEHVRSRPANLVLNLIGKGADIVRTGRWVHRHDVIIVPGAGVLEASLPVRPWENPYALFLVCAWGRALRTKVALVSVGADTINQRVTRWLSNGAARSASYRSYRDTMSRDAMRQRGLDVSRDEVYPDMVLATPIPPRTPGDLNTVGVGVMAYFGSNGDRAQGKEIYTSYVAKMRTFIQWLVDQGRTVRLFVGDSKADDCVVQELVGGVQCGSGAGQVVADRVSSFGDLVQSVQSVGSVVAIRFHNVMCGLLLSKPTISLSYSKKHDELMASMGQGDYCQPAKELNVDRLIEQFRAIEKNAPEIRRTLTDANEANALRLDEQFRTLSVLFFGAHDHETSLVHS